MKRPTTPEEVKTLHQILRKDPQRYIQITSDHIRENPRDSQAYFDRHNGWMKIGEPQLALEDLNKAIELSPSQVRYAARGAVHRHMGEYHQALEDFERGEALDPQAWNDDPVALVHQADCHARLGNEEKALAYGSRLSDTFYMPGLGAPPGGYKPDILDGLRRIAARSRRFGGGSGA